MSKQAPARDHFVQPYRYPSPKIPLAAIKRFARRIAAKFHPLKIVLFGSYAYGTPHDESDVDLLVIMPARNVIDQAVRISLALDWPFSLDLIVRTPKQIERGLRPEDCDWFLSEVMEKGKVLYEAPHRSVGTQGRRGRGLDDSPGRLAQAAPGRQLLSLPTGRRKIPQSAAARIRRGRAANPQPK